MGRGRSSFTTEIELSYGIRAPAGNLALRKDNVTRVAHESNLEGAVESKITGWRSCHSTISSSI